MGYNTVQAQVNDEGDTLTYNGRTFVSQGRFTADNTFWKWVTRLLAVIGVLTLLALGLAAVGVHALFT